MAWTIVETPNARYVIIFTTHWQKTEKIPKDFDALILEYAGEPPFSFEPYMDILEQAAEKGKQVWVTDAGIEKRAWVRARLRGALTIGAGTTAALALLIKSAKSKRRAFLKKILAVGCLLPLLNSSLILRSARHGKIKSKMTWAAQAKLDERISGPGKVTIRNLLTAEKCENWLAPRLQQELGRKPVIAMVWGGAHYGICSLLKNPERRVKLHGKYYLFDYLTGRYTSSYKILLDSNGRVIDTEEVKHTWNITEKPSKPKKRAQLSRRQFLSKVLAMRRRR